MPRKLMIFPAFLLLSCHVLLATSDCPKSQEWRQMEVSPGGALVCARLYGDQKCSGFPLPFGINASSSDLGTASSSAINFERNNVTALVRPGCNMYLWEGAGFTGEHVKSSKYIWNVNRRHYRSALCNCTVGDLELLQCELREKWEVVNICDFRKSDIGGLCSVTLKRSYARDEDGNVKNITITKNLANLFTDKIAEFFGEERMTSFLDIDSDNKLPLLVGATSVIKIKQRSYVCGQYHLFTPEVLKRYERKDDTGVAIVPQLDKWIYNQLTETYFWFSSAKEGFSTAKEKCKKLGGQLAHLYTVELQNWIKPLFESNAIGQLWIYGVLKGHRCIRLFYNKDGFNWSVTDTCNDQNQYVCEGEVNDV
ncbi:hypothetical protein Ddc_17917 [Ditylenchus destructor]|nr:hypothetical protein Ddc_17917 [Ditylenchus destructor]